MIHNKHLWKLGLITTKINVYDCVFSSTSGIYMHKLLLGAGRNKFQCTDTCTVDVKDWHERLFIRIQNNQAKCFKFSLRAPVQLNPHLMFLWGGMEMNAKLRKILKLSTFSNLKWGKPLNCRTLNGSSTVCMVYVWQFKLGVSSCICWGISAQVTWCWSLPKYGQSISFVLITFSWDA
jgi:hypothetical protein